jgi:hypothetical protein
MISYIVKSFYVPKVHLEVAGECLVYLGLL